jgi:outer membrane porin, OprD family
MKKIFVFTAGLLLAVMPVAYSQHQEINEKPSTWSDKQVPAEDSTSLIYAFKKGTIHGHFRYFFMATDNASGLTDYYANAVGGGIKYETAKFHGFQVGVSGFYIFNIGSSDLTVPDESTGQFNRYEIGLFDITNPENKSDIDALEELYVKYNFRNSFVRYGKQLLNTPFINLQDGRMRPGVTEGLWFEINEIRKIRIEAGWLYGFSPRSTSKWYRADESIGLYPTGVNVDGTKSGYAGNLSSEGVFYGGLTYSANEILKVQAWNMFTEKISNTTLLQADLEFSMKDRSVIYAGLQGIMQRAMEDGGNADPSKTYFEKDGEAYTYGLKAGWKDKRLDVNLNYNRITSDGRYLMPREWGRDPFFTFLPRERNEGFGDVHAGVARVEYKFPKLRLKTSLAAGYYRLPDVKNFRLNKYGMPSYTQLNADLRYNFGGVLKGLDLQFLVAGKFNDGETYGNDRYVINKVDMINYNLVFNFRF